MVEKDVAARKVASATARLHDVAELVERSREDFLDDLRGRDLAAFYFLLAVQDCVDLASHWVSDASWQPPEDAGSAFDVLADHGVLPRDLADALRQAVGLRNVIAHGYANLDHGRFYDEIRRGLPLLERFLSLIADTVGL